MKIVYAKNKRCLNTIFFDFFLCTAFADAAVDPIDFPIAPAYAVPKVGIKLLVFWKTAKFLSAGSLVETLVYLPEINTETMIFS